MSISKNSLNSFANQYNVAVSTKAVYFRVIDSEINRNILSLLYKEGFISGYSFNFEDVYLPESKGKLKKNDLVFVLSRTKQTKINSRPYFFNFQSVAVVKRSKIEPEEITFENKSYVESAKENFDRPLLKDNLYRGTYKFSCFLVKFLLLYYTLYERVDQSIAPITAWSVFNNFHIFRFRQNSNILVGSMNIDSLFDSVCNAVLDLKAISEQSDYIHKPVHLAFSKIWEDDLLSFLEGFARYGVPYQESIPVTRLELQLNYAQDKWKFTDVAFDKEYIFVYPKYRSGVGVLKKMSVGSDTVL